MSTLRVLIAEDNLDIAANIGDFLEFNGHQVDFAYDGKMAVNLVETQRFDIIIMDIMMPKMDGLKATEQIRTLTNGDVPILMLTAKDTLEEKLEGFDAGADDYLVKPFEMSELYARMQAQTRKAHKDYGQIISLRGIAIDPKKQLATVEGKPLALNPTTFKIMTSLTKAYPDLVNKKDIEFMLWGETAPKNDILRSHIYNLRKSLSKCSELISVVGKHGKGYQLHIEETA